MKNFLLLIIAALLVSNANAQWQTNGPYGGHITCFDTSGPNIFAGTNYGGVYLSTNNGDTWTTVNIGFSETDVNALASSGSNIFAGTDSGVFLSTNNGGNWTRANSGLPAKIDVYAFAICSFGILAGTDSGVYLSTNNGGSWTVMNNGLPADKNVMSFAISGSNIFAGVNNILLGSGDVYLSTNNGSSWTALSDAGFPYGGPYVNSLAVIGSNLFAAIYENDGGGSYLGVYLTTDTGSNWIALPDIEVYLVNALAVNDANIFAGATDGGVFLSTDTGATWTAVNNGLTNNIVTALAIRGPNIYAGVRNNGGDNGAVFLSNNNGGNWTSSLYTSGHVQSLATSGSNVFAGTDAGVFLSTNNGGNWVTTGLSANTDVRSIVTSGSNIFAVTDSGLFLSTNNAGNWTRVNTGLTDSDDVYSLAINGSNIFAGTDNEGMFLSTNNGNNWTAVNNAFDLSYNRNITALAITGSSIFADTYGDGQYLSTNNGSNWTAAANPLPNNPTYISSFAINGSYIYAGLLAYDPTFTGSGVFLSTNNCNTWTEMSTGLPIDAQTKALAISGSNIFAGIGEYFSDTALGVFLSTNNEGIWTSVNTGLTDSAYVTSLAIIDSMVFVGTGTEDGADVGVGGVWQRSFPGLNCVPSAPPVNTTEALALTIDSGSSTTLTASGIGTLSWYSANNGGIYLGNGESFTTPVITTTTTFYVQDSNCSASNRTAITVTIDTILGIAKVDGDGDFKIYPNPAISNFVVKTPAIGKQQLQVFDITGKLILSQLISNSKTTIDATSLADGIYMVRLTNNSSIENTKLVIAR